MQICFLHNSLEYEKENEFHVDHEFLMTGKVVRRKEGFKFAFLNSNELVCLFFPFLQVCCCAIRTNTECLVFVKLFILG